ncbi:hypothetical protein, partial [Pantoea ananatis]|uniref:hypothetical protein n=1 Tax=Pantoea ananas TaxID=553 RepID=UPI001B30F583
CKICARLSFFEHILAGECCQPSRLSCFQNKKTLASPDVGGAGSAEKGVSFIIEGQHDVLIIVNTIICAIRASDCVHGGVCTTLMQTNNFRATR